MSAVDALGCVCAVPKGNADDRRIYWQVTAPWEPPSALLAMRAGSAAGHGSSFRPAHSASRARLLDCKIVMRIEGGGFLRRQRLGWVFLRQVACLCGGLIQDAVA